MIGDSGVDNGTKKRPLSLEVCIDLSASEDVLVSRNGHNADVVLEAEFVAQLTKSGDVALGV